MPLDNHAITALFQNLGIPASEDVRLLKATLKSELTLGNLVGAHITWSNTSTGHMLLVYGCKNTKFLVFDPCLGAGAITYNELFHYADGDGTWDLSWRNL